MKRNFRLTQSTDLKRVRRSGKSYAHPFIVLIVLPAEGEQTKIGVIASRTVGSAVQRNKAKRLVREAVRLVLNRLQPGWNAVLIARNPILKADFSEIEVCLQELFTRAQLLKN